MAWYSYATLRGRIPTPARLLARARGVESAGSLARRDQLRTPALLLKLCLGCRGAASAGFPRSAAGLVDVSRLKFAVDGFSPPLPRRCCELGDGSRF